MYGGRVFWAELGSLRGPICSERNTRVIMWEVFPSDHMTTDLQPHPLAQLFPPISQEELAELGRDIALHGQLEPIVLYQGKILDGVNSYRACRRMKRAPEPAHQALAGTSSQGATHHSDNLIGSLGLSCVRGANLEGTFGKDSLPAPRL